MTNTFIADLAASQPHPERADDLLDFGQFVGTWNMVVRFYDDAGALTFDRPGRWTFGWVLDGRAVQDVLTYPPRSEPAITEPGRRGIGTTLRFFHPGDETWHVYWLGAVTGTVVILRGGRVGNDLVLHSDPELDGTLNRWVFTEITSTSFRWIGHESNDGGTTWRLRQEMLATRPPA